MNNDEVYEIINSIKSLPDNFKHTDVIKDRYRVVINSYVEYIEIFIIDLDRRINNSKSIMTIMYNEVLIREIDEEKDSYLCLVLQQCGITEEFKIMLEYASVGLI